MPRLKFSVLNPRYFLRSITCALFRCKLVSGVLRVSQNGESLSTPETTLTDKGYKGFLSPILRFLQTLSTLPPQTHQSSSDKDRICRQTCVVGNNCKVCCTNPLSVPPSGPNYGHAPPYSNP